MISWENIHYQIKEGCLERFNNGHFAEAVSYGIIELNDVLKNYIHHIYLKELDGTDLFFSVFSHKQPYLTFNVDNNNSAKNIQEGYMHIFAGSWMGIRNPKAHRNLNVDQVEAIEMIILISHLFRMLDKAIFNNIISLVKVEKKIKTLSQSDFLYLNEFDDRRWIIIDNKTHHINDGPTHAAIQRLNKHLNSPTKLNISNFTKFLPGPEIKVM